MKKLLCLLLPCMVLWLSCSDGQFLDDTITTDLDYNAVFSDSTYTVGFLTEIYKEVGFDTNPSRFSDEHRAFGGLQTACDEAQYRIEPRITTDVQFVTGTINPVIITDDAWSKCYENIRRANVFLASVDKSPLSQSRKTTYKAEARFLRAWYYFILLRHYGGIPLIGDNIYGLDDEIKTERNSFEECVEYIVSECTEAAGFLTAKPMGRDNGRAGAGACRALISRVRLYAASPLFNGSNFGAEGFDKKLVGYPNYDIDRWKQAMDAAQSVIAMGTYDLYVDNSEEAGRGFYRIMFYSNWAQQGVYVESIFDHKAPYGSGRENLFSPPSRGRAAGGFPYQEFVDDFPMKNGKSISDPASGYQETDPYKDRDPRFYNTIVIDQTVLPNKGGALPINIYLLANGTPSGQDAVHQGTSTGYYINKMVSRDIAANDIHGGAQDRPLMRYGEILLNYAEARNEYSGPSDEIYEILKRLRERGGIEPGDDNMFGLKENMSQIEMREAIRLERRLELAIEGHRFWDVRRWMIAEDTENRMMTGMEVYLQADGSRQYVRFNVQRHIFAKQMYLWPFPDREVAKSTKLVQNPYY